MPRIRTIKPAAFASDSLSRVSIAARWTFAGLWTYVDDAGRGRADVRLIKAAVWPMDDDISGIEVAAYLDELEREKCICRYESGGRVFLHVINWDHQKISHPTATIVPECSREQHGGLSAVLALVPEPLANPPESFCSDLERKGKEKDAAPRATVAAAPESDGARANRLTKTFTDQVKLSNFPAVAGIVRKAVKAGYTDQAIVDALSRLADDKRSVTTDTLRTELEGPAPPRRGQQADVWLDAYNSDQIGTR